MQNMNYEVAREKIKSGDIIHIFNPGWRGLRTLFYAAILFFTGSRIYHTAVAMWMTTETGSRRLMCVEANVAGGKRIVPMSLYSGRKIEITQLPDPTMFARMEPALMRKVSTQSYGLLDFVGIGMNEFFGIEVSYDFKGEVCSELVANALISAGVPLSKGRISPGRLYSELSNLGMPATISINLAVHEDDY